VRTELDLAVLAHQANRVAQGRLLSPQLQSERRSLRRPKPICQTGTASPGRLETQTHLPGSRSRPEETLLASIMSIAIMPDGSRAGFTIVNTVSERSHVLLIEGWARSVALWRQLLPPCFGLHATDEDPLTGLSASPVIAWLRSKVPRVAQG
jgi:hypothetical protein